MKRNTTMLELVCEVSRYARTDTEVVERVSSLVNSGRVRLCGSFRGSRLEQAQAPAPGTRSEGRVR